MNSIRHRNFRALQAFEAVARNGSFTAAAAELGVTQSAISHQVRHLTSEFGEKLVRKVGRKLELTPTGERLANRLRTAFEQIDTSIDDTVGANRPIVRLAVCSSFAPGWLIRRLDSLYGSHPTFSLQLRMYAKDPDLTDQVADAFVTSFPMAPGFSALHLKSELLVAVRAPSSPDLDSERVRIITTDIDPDTLGKDWIDFIGFADLPADLLDRGDWLQASHYVLALEMARHGLGVALVPDFLAEESLATGEIALASEARMPTHEDYYLCIKTVRRSEPALRQLEGWFRSHLPRRSANDDLAMNRIHTK